MDFVTSWYPNTCLSKTRASDEGHQVTHCQSLGKVNVNVVTDVVICNRDPYAVEANLLQLGQNNAIEIGGDSLVKDVTPEFGKQVFAIYKCKRWSLK